MTASSQLLAAATDTGNGEAVTFWLLAPVALLGALGVLVSKKAVHSALALATTMLSLAVLYLAQDAPFLGVVQVVVYTGAVMMLFLFVLMLVGVDSGDSLVETLRGQRIAAVLIGIGFGALLVLALGDAIVTNEGLEPGQPGRQRAGPGEPHLLPLRVRLRGDQRTADHRGAGRHGPGPPRAPRAPAHPAGPLPPAVPRRREPGAAARPRRLRAPQRRRHPRPAAGRHAGRGVGVQGPHRPR